jgi:release factor glutamine methyltransferase
MNINLCGFTYSNSGRKIKIKTWKLIELLNVSAGHLQQKGVENPRLNAEILLTHVLNVKRIDLYLNFERPLTLTELETYRTYLKRRLQHEPLQYITQVTEFMSLPFKVDRSVLIPRPETEILVETILAAAKRDFSATTPLRILDIGTGSGNIAVSLAKYLPQAQIIAIDISASALAIATQNAQLNQVAPQILFQPADCTTFRPERVFDIVVSNPPYISTPEFRELPPEVKHYEPSQALLAEENGLRFYRILGQRAAALIKTGGLLAVEIGFRQGQAVSRIFRENHLANIQIIPDLNQHDRVVTANWAG